ncbi:Olfactory receptor 1J4 [Chelonia mydas]|uniref:Olfactory receptor 1J4 n=1 Tax=Chelonia mydas TaxID=8469 RepID=M7ALF4_CHEMY|nr:Olfactory receptor 1J4 [Chelonia mydas]
MYFFIADSFLLAAMLLDLYVAVCRPPRYPAVTRPGRSWWVPHFFCDIFPLLHLSCSLTWLNALVLHTKGALVVNVVLVFILLSYDAGTVIWVYFQPSSSFSAEKDALAAVMYTVVTPRLNPFIYTLRNDEMKGALRKAVSRMVASPGTGYDLKPFKSPGHPSQPGWRALSAKPVAPRPMDSTNGNVHPDFLLLGLSSRPGQEHLLFSLFLCLYLLNLLVNLQILLLTRSDPRRHGSPMPFLLLVLSYARILRVPERRGKACGAHLAVVGLFYGTAIGVYFPPPSSYSGDRDKLASVTYTVVTPTLNPFIYRLCNQDIKAALRQGPDTAKGE